MNINVLQLDAVDSTNSEAARQAKLGAPEGLCVIAKEQTAGRGRLGRKWHSQKGSGLYFSIVLRPQLAVEEMPLITLMAGVAVFDMLCEFGLKPDIKWVNDIHIDGRKIAGILAETVESSQGTAVIVGIGINLTSDGISPDIAPAATSIKNEAGVAVSSADAAEALTKYLTYFYGVLSENGGPAATAAEWTRRSSYASGKNVRVMLEDETIYGITAGIMPNGALRVETASGIRVIQAGDVEQLRQYSQS